MRLHNLTIAILLLSVRLLGASAINVSSVATAGDGSADDTAHCWTGRDTAIVWTGSQQYNFPSGFYCYQTSPNFLKTGIALVGEAGTVLKHTGSGNAVVFDNPTSWTFGTRFENFIIQGNERMFQLSGTSTINTDASWFSMFYFVAFQNFLLANPTSGINGQAVTWRIQQDNYGSHLISFGSKFRAKGTFPVLATAPLEFDYITARYNAARDTWDIQ